MPDTATRDQSYPAALQYAYRPDGKRDRLALGNGTAFSWTYTAAGRLLTQSDPLTGTTVSPSATYTSNKVEKPYYPSSVTYGPWRQAFDSYGRVASITLPVSLFAYTGSQFDLEDGVTQHTASGYIPTPAPPPYAASQLVCLQSSIRNEKTPLALSQQTYCSMGPSAPIEVNGTQFTPIPRNRFTSAQNWTLDARAGMMLHNTQPLSSDTMGSSFAYDLSGRLTQDFEGGAENVTKTTNPALTQAWCPGVSPPDYAAVVCYSNGSRAKTYDAENRLHSETFTYAALHHGNRRPDVQHDVVWVRRIRHLLVGQFRIRPAAQHPSRRLRRHEPSDAIHVVSSGGERHDGNARLAVGRQRPLHRVPALGQLVPDPDPVD